MPGAWIVSRVAREFGLSPQEALEQPADLVDEVMDLRLYQRAYDMIVRGNADERELLEQGIPESLISEVMDNVRS